MVRTGRPHLLVLIAAAVVFSALAAAHASAQSLSAPAPAASTSPSQVISGNPFGLLIDLLNAENETYQSQTSAVTERMELLQVKYRLLGAIARLNPVLDIPAAAPVPEPDGAAAPDVRQLPELR